jgi:four helix bundle protein
MKDFHHLKVWEKAHALSLSIYKASSSFPKGEIYGLTNQIRRAAISTPTNIAEGCGRGSDADLSRFLQSSMGSASEVEYLLLVCHDLGFLTNESYEKRNTEITEVKRMLTGLIKTLKTDR